MVRYFTILFVLFVFVSLKGQTDTATLSDNLLRGKVIEGDTLPHVFVKEIVVMPPFKFKSTNQRKKYSRLVRNIKKTLPYARLAQKRLYEIERKLDSIPDKKERKVYLKEAEKQLFEEFEQPLRKLTFSQGRMLIKLIDRETGDTSYELIKDLKGGFSAFMWQSVARIFGSNLKSEYDSAGDDKMIEYIIVLIDNGLL